MRKLIARWLINSAIDDNRTHKLPGWVAKLVLRDGQMAQDIEQQQQLADALKNDATVWVEAHNIKLNANLAAVPGDAPVASEKSVSHQSAARDAVRLRTSPVETGSRLMRWSTVTAAVCVLIAAVSIFSSGTPTEPPSGTGTAFKVEEVREALSRSENLVRKLTNEAQELAVTAPVKRPAELGKLTTKYVEEAGSFFGRGLAVLNDGGR